MVEGQESNTFMTPVHPVGVPNKNGSLFDDSNAGMALGLNNIFILSIAAGLYILRNLF